MIARFVLLDLHGLARKPWRILAGLGTLVLISAAILPAFAIPLAAVFAVVIVPDAFLMDERGRLDILYATLPISRTTVVVGRYVTSIVVYVLAAAVGNAITLLAPEFGGAPTHPAFLALVNVAGFIVAALGLAIQLPVFFAIGFTKARFASLLPAIAVLVAITIGHKSGLFSGRLAATLTGSIPPAIAVTSVAAGVALLVISALAARSVYQRRSL